MSRIPKILHYCFGFAPDFGGKPWSLVHHVGVASAIRHIQPDQVCFYYEYEPQGPWWELTKALVTPIRIAAPKEIFGQPLLHPAHQADVVRLQKLIEHGGIYLDADVLVHRSFDDLLDKSTVLGREGFGGVAGMANAVILAEPQAPFLTRWLERYRSFRGKSLEEHWNEHSVRVPAELADQHPDEITVLPSTAFFWPLWTTPHIEWIFNSPDPIPLDDAYASHLWESKAWHYLGHLAPGDVRARDTNFHRWARPYVAELPDNYGIPLARLPISLAKRLKKRLRALADGGPAAAPPPSAPAVLGRKETFKDIYKSAKTGAESGSEFFSGVGSRGPAVDDYVRNMTALLQRHAQELGRPPVVVDIGCGDFAVGQALIAAVPAIRYIGCDIVPPLIAHNRQKFSSDTVAFQELDVVSQRPPQGDICLVRQVLQHLSNAEVGSALDNLTGFHAVYVTEGQPEVRVGPPNPDKAVGADVRFDWRRGVGRGLELGSPPFNAGTREVFRTWAFPHEVIVTDQVTLE